MPISGALCLTGLILGIPGLICSAWYSIGGEPQPWWTKTCMLTGAGFLVSAAWSAVAY